MSELAECLFCHVRSRDVAENMILPVCPDCDEALERERRAKR